MSTELLEPVVNDGVRLTHFFNGRVLTAEDLRREQDAARDRHRDLAGAVGEGVVRGLEVTALRRDLPAPTVRITAGLAFNRDGDPVDLPRDVELRLIPAQAEVDQEAGLFALCERAAAVSTITNPGFYLLAARPASAYSREQVPLVDVSSNGIGSHCGSKYAELGASFSLVPLPLPAGGADAPLAQRLSQLATAAAPLVEQVRSGVTGAVELELARTLSKLRNGMAYWCAGRDAAGARVVSLAPSAAATVTPPTPLEALRTAGALPSCDIPLALLYVTRRQLEWVDMWAVRRAPVPRVGPEPLPLADGLPAAEAAAAFMQFRDHASSFLQSSPPLPAGQVKASDWFLFLPPVGVLSLQSGASPGFTAATFFGGRPFNGPAALESARIPALLRGSLEHAPIDLANEDERAWLYSVTGLTAPGSPPCLLFAGYPVEQELTILPVRISQVEPNAPVHEGDPLRVRGENFEGADNHQQVLVDGVPVAAGQYVTKKDDELVFFLPRVAGMPPQGKNVLLAVGNRSTFALRSLMLLPRAGAATGTIDVEYVHVVPTVTQPALAVIQAGSPAVIRFSIRNRTDLAGMVRLSATVSESTFATQILPAAQAPSTAAITELGMMAGEERSVFVRIPTVPTGTEGEKFTVRLNADLVNITGSSGFVEFEVLGEGEETDEGVSTFALAGSNPSGALAGTLLSVSPYYPVQAVFNLEVREADPYVVTAIFVDTAGNEVTPSGWAVSIIGATAADPHHRTFVVTEQQLEDAEGLVGIPLQVQLNAQFFGAANAEVLVTVQRTGQPIKREVRFTVRQTGWIWYYGYYGF